MMCININPIQHHSVYQRCWKIFKYVYVISAICIGLLIVCLQQISDPFDDWLQHQQQIILTFLINDNEIYIILALFVITILKSFGVKDIFGLRTISVIILSYRMINNPPMLTLLVSMLMIGILSSISKLIEYKVIGRELQVVQGTPIQYIFKYLRKMLLFCIKNEKKLEWFDPKWIFEISEKSRDDSTMDVMSNIESVAVDLKCKCNNNNDDNNDIESAQNNQENTRKSKIKCTATHILSTTIYFIISVIWTSVIEWVQPITELFLFAHHWNLSIRNTIIIILSEFADFDKAVEAWFLINGLNNGLDIIQAKIHAVLSKFVFWALGYCLVLPFTLIWAYLYHKKNIAPNQQCKHQNNIQLENRSNNVNDSTTTNSSSYTHDTKITI